MRPDELEGFVGHLGDVDLFDVELHLAGLDLGQIQQAVDEAEQVIGGLGHAEEVGLLLRGHLAVQAVEHQLCVADDRVHRRAELVADRRQELALEAVRPLELKVVHAQLADEIGVLVRDRHQTSDRAQRPRLGIGELALIVEVRREETDGAAARRERDVRDESQVAGGDR